MTIQATVTNTITSGYQVLTAPAFIANQPPRVPFMLDMREAVNLQNGGVANVLLDDSDYSLAFQNRWGFNLHSDQFLREAEMRRRKTHCANHCVPANADLDAFAHFRCMVEYDPPRLIVLDCLPPSTFIPELPKKDC